MQVVNAGANAPVFCGFQSAKFSRLVEEYGVERRELPAPDLTVAVARSHRPRRKGGVYFPLATNTSHYPLKRIFRPIYVPSVDDDNIKARVTAPTPLQQKSFRRQA